MTLLYTYLSSDQNKGSTVIFGLTGNTKWVLESLFAFAVTAFYDGNVFAIEIVHQSNGLL